MKTLLKLSIIFISTLLVVQTAYTHTLQQKPVTQDIMIHKMSVKTTPPGISNSAAYFHIMNHSEKDIRLTGAESDAADIVEIHEHTMANGVMKMQKVESIMIPAGSSVEFKPGGYHIMLIGVTNKINTGDKVDIKLTFSNGTIKKIRASASETVNSTHHKHKHH
jgi:copper(I)-binding protein